MAKLMLQRAAAGSRLRYPGVPGPVMGAGLLLIGVVLICFNFPCGYAQAGQSIQIDGLMVVKPAKEEPAGTPQEGFAQGSPDEPALAKEEDSQTPQKNDPVHQMDTVVVTGSRTGTESPEQMAVPVQVVTSEQLQEIGAVSLGQALEAIQGVELIQCPDMNAAPGAQTLRMRGMDANHVLVLVNGRRQPGTRPDNQGFAFTDISGINISDIERIEVLRDGASAQYGADAVAGVINIVLRKYNPRFSANTQYGLSTRGDAQEKQVEVSTGLPAGENLFFNISANGRKSSHYDRTPDTPRWTTPDVEQAGISVKASLDISPDQFLDGEVRYNQTDSVMRIGKTGPLSKDRSNNKKDYYGGLTWEGDFDQFNFESGLGLGLSDTEYRKNEDSDYNGDLSSDVQNIYLHMNWDVKPWITFFVGTSFNREAVDAPYRDFEEERKVYALFAETQVTLFDHLRLTFSGRVEEYSDFGTNFAPKVSARYECSKNLAFRASVSRSFQVPTLYQLYDQFEDAMSGYDIYGNPDLDPAEGLDYNIGAVWTPLGPGSIELTVDVYRNDINNMIEADTITESTATANEEITYVNLDGTSTFEGVEIGAGLPLPWGFDLDLTGNYLKARDPDGKDLTNRPRSSLHAALTYRYKDRLTANIRYIYRGKYLSDTAPEERIESFDYVNFQITYALTKSMSLFFGGRNIFDEAPPVDLSDYEGGHKESMLDSPLGAYYYGGLRMSF